MGAVKVDAKVLEALIKRLEQADKADKKDEFFEVAAKNVTARYLRVVKRATPKKTGELRRGWTGGKDANPETYANALAVQKNGTTYAITVENQKDYSSYVELGHRIMRGGKQVGYVPPQYFMQRSEAAFEPHVPRFLEKKLTEFLGDAFNG